MKFINFLLNSILVLALLWVIVHSKGVEERKRSYAYQRCSEAGGVIVDYGRGGSVICEDENRKIIFKVE